MSEPLRPDAANIGSRLDALREDEDALTASWPIRASNQAPYAAVPPCQVVTPAE
ncbi:hypothetical protein [Streptomyces sp. NPDC001404]|uniref:hypothetical protein n=1 Tax=Streptomyces sp. NPDC001404 TaxID=3364571 RepID=UPI0036BB0B8A